VLIRKLACVQPNERRTAIENFLVLSPTKQLVDEPLNIACIARTVFNWALYRYGILYL